MKAAMNGVPNISIMDRWWVEGYHDGLTGWKFGYEGAIDDADLSENPESLLYLEDADAFYELLPSVLEMFYSHPEMYLSQALNNLQLNIPIFNTHRMAAEYVEQYSLRLDPQIKDKTDLLRQLYQSEQPIQK